MSRALAIWRICGARQIDRRRLVDDPILMPVSVARQIMNFRFAIHDDDDDVAYLASA